MAKLDFGLEVIGKSLLANAGQVKQIFINYSQKNPGQLSTYEDLWRFTLVNYYAGPGCLSAALESTLEANMVLDWQNVSARLEGDCKKATGYIEIVTDDR